MRCILFCCFGFFSFTILYRRGVYFVGILVTIYFDWSLINYLPYPAKKMPCQEVGQLAKIFYFRSYDSAGDYR